jgi:hypothetical protein
MATILVPYHAGVGARAMIARALQSSGTRAQGRVPSVPPGLFPNRRTIQPIVPNTTALSGLCCADCATNIPYEAAKRGLSGFGITSLTAPVGAGAGAGAAIGASQGASIGSAIVPGVGTAIGAAIGAIGGAIAGAINKKDPEQYNFDQAVALWQANPDAVYSIGNKYLPLAGLFDLSLKNPHIPIYQKYGRMGEQKFVTDLVNLIYRAGLSGQISTSDTPITVFSNIVQPWINSWGYGPMQDPHADLINRLMIGMVLDYVTGDWKTAWFARSGDFPFSSLPSFQLPAAAPPPPAAAPAPPPVALPSPATPQVPALPAPAPTPVPTPVSVQPVAPIGVGAAVAPVAALTPPPSAVTPLVATPTAPVVTSPSCTSPLVWNGTACVLPTPTTTPAPTSSPTGLPVATVAASPPAGFSVIGNDTNGNPVFSNSQGVLYQWNGTAMQMFVGQLQTGQSVAAQVQAAVQSALAQGQTTAQAAQTALAQVQSQGVAVTPAIQSQVTDQTAAAATAPTTVTMAGVSGFGSTGLLVVLGVVGVLFATARPHKGSHYD